jgi:hypothetical protein
MISPNIQLLITMALSASILNAMESQYQMTIKNELFCKIFLNTTDPRSLTSQSPYPFIEGQTSKTFLINEKEKTNQALTFPNGYPSDTVRLPIEKDKTCFTIKQHPQEWQKVIVQEDESKKIISELIILCNPK